MTILIVCAVMFTVSQWVIAAVFFGRAKSSIALEKAAEDGWRIRSKLDAAYLEWFHDEGETEWRRLKSARALFDEKFTAWDRSQIRDDGKFLSTEEKFREYLDHLDKKN